MSKIFILASFTFIGIGCTAQRISGNGQLQEKTDERLILSIVQFFKDNEHLPMRDRIDRFYELKKEDPSAYDFENEEALNFYGYQLLWNNQDDDAYLIFEMLVSEFPNSANVYDSFAEICLKKGEQELALVNYKKSLELNPDNFNAEDQIAFLLDPTLKPENPAEKFLKVYSVKEYQQDLDEFGKKITTTHPNVFKFLSERDFWELIEQKKNLITTETTFADFMWHCDEIIASINCAHSSLFGFYQEMDMLPVELCFPLQTSWINERLFVIDPMNNGDVVKVKDEITSINGVAVADLVKGIYKHLPSQAYIETTKRHLFNTWSSCFIPYELSFPDSYTITLNGSGKELELNKAKDKRIYFGDPSIQNCQDALCLEFLNNDETAILTIKSFDFYKFRDSYQFFESFINESFSEINSKKCKNLIIDVRGNGGGSQSASIHLLRYLVDHPFTYYSNVQFEGKTEKIEGEDSSGTLRKSIYGKYFVFN
ncbi:MAG: S41 family peptidase [Flavobacteriales bacterium]